MESNMSISVWRMQVANSDIHATYTQYSVKGMLGIEIQEDPSELPGRPSTSPDFLRLQPALDVGTR